MKIKRKEHSIIYEDAQGKEVASLTYKEDQNIYYLIGTYVDPSLRGQGIAGKLFYELIELLKETKTKVSPVCSYSVSWFEKHPEYSIYVQK